ncbi:CsgG/HfaB family protein [Brachyspira sp.]|uniref:CsgG/HfaB family protein n=1 Tax=Brachyspira sp. TaxID=1977261 RepID=UPI002621302C|nr:CsgG/HfaB family protein [Brachyspira sp.]
MIIKKIIFIILIFPSILLSKQVRTEIGERYEKENIAVFEILDDSRDYSKGIGKKMTALIEHSLTKMNRFNIVDRQNLDKYLKEMELQLAGITDKQLIEVGKIYGYSKALTGKIVSANVTVEYNDDETISLFAEIEMVLQIVDVETTKILYSSKLRGTSYYSTTSYPSNSLRESLINDACNNLAYKVENKMRDTFKIVLKISDIYDGKVYLLVGRNQGINKKTRFRVYSKQDDIILSSGNVISGGYKHKGTLRIKELNNDYLIASISRGRNIQVGDIAKETVIGDFGFGIALNYASYNITPFQKTYQNSIKPNEGKMRISLNKNEYALGIHVKMGYNGILFSPNLSLGLLFGDFFKSSYAIDTRFNFDININLYQEVLKLIISPYIGMGISFTTIGEIYGGNYYTDNFIYLKNGAKIDSRDIMFGIGALASLQYNVTDTIGINFGVGYRFYTNPINLGIFSEGNEISLPENIKTVNLTGLEFTLGAFFIL